VSKSKLARLRLLREYLPHKESQIMPWTFQWAPLRHRRAPFVYLQHQVVASHGIFAAAVRGLRKRSVHKLTASGLMEAVKPILT